MSRILSHVSHQVQGKDTNNWMEGTVDPLFSSQNTTSRRRGAQRHVSSAAPNTRVLPDTLPNAVAVEAALSLALHEVFAIMIVDQFLMIESTDDDLVLSMCFRAPLGCAEVPLDVCIGVRSAESDGAATLVESIVGLTLADLFGAVAIEETCVNVNQAEQVACTITARVPICPPSASVDMQEDAQDLSTR